MRIDKFLSEMNVGSRSQVKQLLQKGQITVNHTICKDPKFHIDEKKDIVYFLDKQLIYQQFFYYMLNKPAGVVSATNDNTCKTVLELLPENLRKNLFPVGRLDKDTEGLLLLTNDGELSHRLLSPKKHVDKTYYVKLEREIQPEDITSLENGIDIGEKEITLPAKLKVISPLEAELTIHEGKFHQVKRMFQATGNKVLYLKRISFGNLLLDEALPLGKYRELNETEITILKQN